jgi:hypothetical protein
VTSRAIVAGDLLALFAFALLGLASHEHEVTVTAFARTFVPFAVCWLLVGGVTGALRPAPDGCPRIGLRAFAAYLAAGVIALVARSLLFDRSLFNAFFVIALAGNGLFLFGWRFAAAAWLDRRSPPNRRQAGDTAVIQTRPRG